MKKSPFVLFACLFVGMIGLGMTMPVLPFYAERLAVAGGASRAAVAFHVTALTSVYALTQLLFAPLWGQQSDRFGRRRLVLIGLLDSAAAQLLFEMATSLWLLYGAQVVGGILSSVTLVVASALCCRSDDRRGTRARYGVAGNGREPGRRRRTGFGRIDGTKRPPSQGAVRTPVNRRFLDPVFPRRDVDAAHLFRSVDLAARVPETASSFERKRSETDRMERVGK